VSDNDDGGLRVLPGGRETDEDCFEAGEVIADLMLSNSELRADVERLKRRERKRNVIAWRRAVVCALVASVATWSVAHATAATDAATSGGVIVNDACRPQHLVDCQHAVRWWKKIAREGRDALQWQRAERLKLKRRISATFELGSVSNWVCIHQHEGAWNDSGDPYWGGLQMDKTFMQTYGADMISKYGGLANVWTPRDQIIVAQRAYKTRGYHPWPNTARMCGLL
jgi:hypothetical protein